LFTSCGSDDDIVIDTGDGDINVGDGLYLALTGANPASSAKLSTETVEAESFLSQDRSGFVGGYMHLEAGDYSIIQVTSKVATDTLGGTPTTITDDGSICAFNDYTLVTTSSGGAAFNVATSGLYRVTHDQMTSELVLYKIDAPALIGNATEGAWDNDTPLAGSVDATGGSWSATEVILRSGQFKVRFNCRWSIARKIDPNGSLADAANGYQFYTNFGGTVDDLKNGNDAPNIEQTEDGAYTVTVDWTPQDGFKLTLDRTGDAPVITFNPNDYQFGIIGDATTSGWDSDQNMFHKEDAGVHTWYGVVSLTDVGEFKFRTNDDWAFDVGGTIDALTQSGANIATPGAGTYYVTISTADEGVTWTGTMDLGGWGLIGDGSPSANWDDDSVMTLESMDATTGITTYVATGDFTTDGWKIRAGGAWDLNLGGGLSFLEVDGDNLTMTAAGNYKLTLSFNGEVYSATADLQ
jgi:hypothetical protein